MPKDKKHTPLPWSGSKCPCGHKACNKWSFDVQGANGLFEKRDYDFAKLAVDSHYELLELARGFLESTESLLRDPHLQSKQRAEIELGVQIIKNRIKKAEATNA